MDIKLSVPFEDKDIVKALGAQYEPDYKAWFITDIQDTGIFDKWKTKEKQGGTYEDDPRQLSLMCTAQTASGRCHYAGTISGEIGEGARFFCRSHFWGNKNDDKITRQSHIEIPHPDYSYEARKGMYVKRVDRDRADWYKRKD